jgi:hypothetical protein
MMGSFDLKWALAEIEKLDPDEKFNTMLMTAAIITKLLELEQVEPIIVGGFSLAIYTDESYSTRDIDFVVSERDKIDMLLKQLGFKKGNQNYVHEENEIVIDFPGKKLAGSLEKINKVIVNDSEELYVYVISCEDIIMDRLRAYLYWKEDISKEWGMQALALHKNKLDFTYMKTVGKGADTENESQEIAKWFDEISKLNQ